MCAKPLKAPHHKAPTFFMKCPTWWGFMEAAQEKTILCMHVCAYESSRGLVKCPLHSGFANPSLEGS